MPTLEEARKELKSKGHRRTDLIISLTGLDRDRLDKVPFAANRIDEHRAALLSRVGDENAEARLTKDAREAKRGETRFTSAAEEIEKAIHYHGEEARKIIEKAPEEHRGGVSLALRVTAPEAVRQALGLGIPHGRVGAYAQFIAAKGLGELKKEMAGKHYSFSRDFEEGKYQVPERGVGSFNAFPARLAAVPNVLADKGHSTIALFPEGESLRELAGSGKVLGSHVKGAVAFAEFHVEDGRLIVSNLQSDLHSAGLPKGTLERYSNWHKMLLAGLRDYAIENGIRQIMVTTAEHQMRRWDRLSPATAFTVYSRIPQEMGFKLKETPPVELDGVKSNLFWVHEVSGTPKAKPVRLSSLSRE